MTQIYCISWGFTSRQDAKEMVKVWIDTPLAMTQDISEE